MEIRKVGICGCGQMGSGIAEVVAKAGYSVVVTEASEQLLRQGLERIDKSLAKALEKGKIDETQKKATMANIKGTVKLSDLADCDMVIEAIVELASEKQKLFIELDKIVKPEAVFASNTSSLSITELAASTSRAADFCGLHFFNPVPVMKLVEVVKTLATSEATFSTAKSFAEKLGKVVVTCGDSPGFVVNRLLVPYLLDAIRAFASGLATKEDIDNGMKLGCGHPMGPLELTDFIGLDTIYYISEILFAEFKDHHYAAPPLLKSMVKAGFLGRKAGRGFYEYTK